MYLSRVIAIFDYDGTVVIHRLGRKNHGLGHHFSWFSPHWVTFLSNQFHFIMPKLKVQKVKVSIFLPPEGEVLDCLGKTFLKPFWKTFVNELKMVDLCWHVIYQNDPMAKPDFMGMVPDLSRRRRRRQARRRVPSHPPEPQEHFKNAFNVPTSFTN